MGERYILTLDCTYCNHTNVGVWYAPTCGEYLLRCSKCKKESFITAEMVVKKIEDVTKEDIREAFLMATSIIWKEEQIKRTVDDYYKNIKGGVG